MKAGLSTPVESVSSMHLRQYRKPPVSFENIVSKKDPEYNKNEFVTMVTVMS